MDRRRPPSAFRGRGAAGQVAQLLCWAAAELFRQVIQIKVRPIDIARDQPHFLHALAPTGEELSEMPKGAAPRLARSRCV